MSKAGRNTGSAGMELHGTDRAAGRTRAGDKSHLFIDQTRTRSINHFNHHLIKNPSNLTGIHSVNSQKSRIAIIERPNARLLFARLSHLILITTDGARAPCSIKF
jgi:hypothetical protein